MRDRPRRESPLRIKTLCSVKKRLLSEQVTAASSDQDLQFAHFVDVDQPLAVGRSIEETLAWRITPFRFPATV